MLIYNVLDLTPVVFLKLSQDQVGESDFVFGPKPSYNISESADVFMYDGEHPRKPVPGYILPFVNATQMQETIKDSDYYEGVSPRWITMATFANSTNPALNTPGIVLLIDSKQEVKIGLGRDFSKKVLKFREAFITHSTLRYLGINAKNHDNVQLVIDLSKYMDLSSKEAFEASPVKQAIKATNSKLYTSLSQMVEILQVSLDPEVIKETLILRIDFKIVEDFLKPQGKFVDSYGNVMIIDCQHILPAVTEALKENLSKQTNNKFLSERIEKLLDPIEEFRVSDYAFQVDGVLKNREKYYINNEIVSCIASYILSNC